MNGLDLSRRYYEACAEKPLKDNFGRLMDRAAVGMAVPRESFRVGPMTIVCTAVVRELHIQGLSDEKSGFLIDHAPGLSGRITDKHLKDQMWKGR